MPPYRRELPGQGLLFPPSELEVVELTPKIDPTERTAIGLILGASAMTLLNLSSERFTEITQQSLAEVEPSSLESDLYGPGYRQVSNLALNAVEYSAMVRWPKPLTTAVKSRTEGRTLDTDTNRREGKIQRSAAHDLEKRLKVSKTVFGGLKSEQERLKLFQGKVEHFLPYPPMTKAELLFLYQNVVNISFKNIVSVVARRRNLTPEQSKQLENSMYYQLTSATIENRKQYLKGLTGVAVRYTNKRVLMFSNKIKHAQTAIGDSYKAARKVDDSK